ncbi:GTP cyclohydrolase I [Duganella sp. FT135W]|uniref:GTP cyclohydrolase I n=1 Tax=Duganella flavida TaxID=2692175 RepID=A0A6L8K8X1_9BURK|nr:GTP cyclohydrolase I [Duganella flavida]MYM22648.1 GTP cyclohydrolase I [Duganella flavida]
MNSRDASLSQNLTPISVQITRRLQAKNIRFYANDNIADHLCAGELELLVDEVAGHFQRALESLVIDTHNDHNTRDTGHRLARMFVTEVFRGRYVGMPAVTTFPNIAQLNELMIVGPIHINSACSHHFCPVIGKLWIGVMPDADSSLIGLSKYARIAGWVLNRPQIQEEAILQLAQVLTATLKPKGLALVLDADHLCMQWRGVKDGEAKFTNSVMQGLFLSNSDLRKEFLSLIRR